MVNKIEVPPDEELRSILAKGHRKTPDCAFPKNCKCEDCSKYHGGMWGMKKLH